VSRVGQKAMKEKSASFILLVSKGILRDRHMRRTVLFWIVIAALLLLGLGATLLDGWLVANPLLFVLYWGACAWLTLTAVLLALFDMLMLRGEAARERRRLKREVLGEGDEGSRGGHPL